MPLLDGLSARLFQWVPFRGLVGKLSLISVVFPAVTVPTAAFTSHFMEVFWTNVGLEALIIVTIAWYGHKHEHTAMLEGPDLVRQHQQAMKARIQDNNVRRTELDQI